MFLYSQNLELAMEAPLNPLFANIFIPRIEKKVMNSNEVNNQL